MPCNKADAVRLARLNGKKMAVKMENINKTNVQIVDLEIVLYTAEMNIIMKTSPFFYE
jgi:hypothetical protein